MQEWKRHRRRLGIQAEADVETMGEVADEEDKRTEQLQMVWDAAADDKEPETYLDTLNRYKKLDGVCEELHISKREVDTLRKKVIRRTNKIKEEKNKTVGRLNVDQMSNAEVYAMWGTTEKEHLGKMFSLIDEENAKVTGATRKHTAKTARFAGHRASSTHKTITVKFLEKKRGKKVREPVAKKMRCLSHNISEDGLEFGVCSKVMDKKNSLIFVHHAEIQ